MSSAARCRRDVLTKAATRIVSAAVQDINGRLDAISIYAAD
jgi:hypothetical protein